MRKFVYDWVQYAECEYTVLNKENAFTANVAHLIFLSFQQKLISLKIDELQIKKRKSYVAYIYS